MASKVAKPAAKASMGQVKHFSEGVKRQTVKDIEQGKCTVLEDYRKLSVSLQSVYGWVYKYSRYLQKNKILIVEDKSESYRSKQLERQLRDAKPPVAASRWNWTLSTTSLG